MRSVAAMEWLLARFAGKRRAAAMMGDLLEQREQRGTWWFWRAVAGVMLAVAWRPVLGFVGALYVCNWSYNALQLRTFGVHAEHRPGVLWSPTLIIVAAASSMMWFVFVYAGIRYGLRARLTQIALATAGVATAIIFGWWQPVMLAACIAAGAVIVIASCMSRERRRAAIALLCTVCVGFVTGLTAMYLEAKYQSFVHPGPMGDREWREHASIAWVAFCLLVAMNCAIAAACSWMHRRLIVGKVQTEIAD